MARVIRIILAVEIADGTPEQSWSAADIADAIRDEVASCCLADPDPETPQIVHVVVDEAEEI